MKFRSLKMSGVNCAQKPHIHSRGISSIKNHLTYTFDNPIMPPVFDRWFL